MKKLVFLSLVVLCSFFHFNTTVNASGNTVVIDPGHGGKFTGTGGYSGNQTGYAEKHANLEVSKRLRDKLVEKGFTVYMTREDDSHFSNGDQQDDLTKRMEIANRFVEGNRDNSIFISVHHNGSVSGPYVRGYETYYFDGREGIDPSYPPDPIQVEYGAESTRLAHIIHDTVLTQAGLREGPNGIKENNFFVTRNAQMPSTLIEIGYMTNPEEEKLIKTAAFQDKVANALTIAVENYFRLYEVYDHEGKLLKVFESKDQAISYAKEQQNVYIFDKLNQDIIYSNIVKRYGVYHASNKEINRLFVTAKEALDYMGQWKHTRVVDNKTGEILNSNYTDEGLRYKVYHPANGVLYRHFQFEESRLLSSRWRNTKVVDTETNRVLWTNYLQPSYQVVHSEKGVLDNFYHEDAAIDYARNWSNTKVVLLSNDQVVFDNTDPNNPYTFMHTKIASNHRITTAIEVSKQLYPIGFTSDHTEKTVILATAYEYADALSAAPLAAQLGNAPILLTNTAEVRTEVIDELARLSARKVIVLGGPNAVSPEISDKLKGLGYQVERIAGTNRIETNQQINARLDNVEGAIVASSRSFADALGAAPIASLMDWAIVLTNSKDMSQNSLDFVNFKQVAIVGGEGVVSADIEKKIINQNGRDRFARLAGTDRYETLAAVLSYFSEEIHSNKVLVATGLDFPDALTASSLSVKTKAPLILVRDNLEPSIKAFLENYGDKNVVEEVQTIGGVVTDQTTISVTNAVK